MCEVSILDLWWEWNIYATDDWDISIATRDSDKDWVPDNMDACVDVPWNSDDGCPVFNDQYCWSYSLCGNGIIEEWEDCHNCPEDVWWCLDITECNSCPCEYADFDAAIIKWDIVRAKLWDKTLSAFYKYSNSVLAESFLDLK